MTSHTLLARVAMAFVVAWANPATALDVGRLGEYNVDPSQVSVSGHQSGAVMAMQIGIAYSSRTMGVGIFGYASAYDCGRTPIEFGLECDLLNTPSTSGLAANIRRMSGHQIDPVEGLARQRVYMFLGSLMPKTGFAKTRMLLEEFVPAANLRFDNSIDVPNMFPLDFDSPYALRNAWTCESSNGGTVSYAFANCGFDGAGATLSWIYGPLKPRTETPEGKLLWVDQGEFASRSQGMDNVGFLYVPKSCEQRAVCKLHVFLHASDQAYFLINDPHYALYSGHRLWADTNDIVLLFPQVYPDEVLNPKGNWDTTGIYDNRFNQKGGTQIEAIMAMVTRITSGFQGGTTRAIEYYHAEFDHYFVTSGADEMAKLDNGTFAGWKRTGESFAVHPLDTPGTSNVCRFFSTAFGAKSSHVYATTSGDCATIKANPDWQFEGVRFAIVLPDGTGGCGTPGSTPVYRLYNNGQGGAPNHRYTTSLATRASMMNAHWVPEGEGVGVVGCATQ